MQKACKNTNKNDFLDALKEMKEVKEGAKEWFNNLEDYSW